MPKSKSAAPKEPSKPKGPMSAYACFVQVIVAEHRKKHPEEHISFAEFSKKCGEKWKTMSAKERKRFEDMATVDKDRYQKELVNFNGDDSTGGNSGRGKKRGAGKPAKDPNKPKRAWSAFFFFCEQQRPQVRALNPDWKVGDVAKELGRQWEQCTDKTPFEKKAKADRERYESDMNAYKAGNYVKKPKVEGISANNNSVANSSVLSAGSGSSIHTGDVDGRSKDEQISQNHNEDDDDEEVEDEEDEDEEDDADS